MTYEQFIQKIKDIGIEINKKTDLDDINEKMFAGDVPHWYDDRNWKKVKPRFDFILEYWSIGGVKGGSWTEDSNPQSYIENGNQPKTFEDLDKILENLNPNITFLQYRKLEQLVQIKEATEYEYYGNCTNYCYRYINLKELYNFLVDNCNLEEV